MKSLIQFVLWVLISILFSLQELRSNYTTDCIFTVYDPDGMDRNNIRIKADGKNNQNPIFSFTEYGETTVYEKQYKLK